MDCNFVQPAPLAGMTIELVTASGSWAPRPGVTTYYVEPCGGGQGGASGAQGAASGGESGVHGFGILRNVTSAISIAIGAGGAPGLGSGGNTTVTFSGATITGNGGGTTTGLRSAKGGSSNNGTATLGPVSGVMSLLLRATVLQTPGAGPSPATSSYVGGSGAPSVVAPGGVCPSMSSAGQAGGLGAGGGAGGYNGGGQSGGSGGSGFVLIGYFEAAA